jgi:UV DNA damage endonuclease
MKLRHLGYACINLSLGCTTGHTLRLANLTADKVGGVIAANLNNLESILEWNLARGIRFFRVSSEVIPFAGHASFPIVWQEAFAARLAEIGAFVAANGVRLSVHPGQYTVLNSPRPEVAASALAELEYHAQFIRGVDPAQGTVTLHVGGAYGDKATAKATFRKNFVRLSPLAQATLILENDDKVYHALEVLELCEALGLPMVFDLFHHKCHHRGESWREGLMPLLARVVATWQGRAEGGVPKFHLSSLKAGSRTSHADTIEQADFEEFVALLAGIGDDEPYDLMLEAKLKDKALLGLHQPQTARPVSP